MQFIVAGDLALIVTAPYVSFKIGIHEEMLLLYDARFPTTLVELLLLKPSGVFII